MHARGHVVVRQWRGVGWRRGEGSLHGCLQWCAEAHGGGSAMPLPLSPAQLSRSMAVAMPLPLSQSPLPRAEPIAHSHVPPVLCRQRKQGASETERRREGGSQRCASAPFSGPVRRPCVEASRERATLLRSARPLSRLNPSASAPSASAAQDSRRAHRAVPREQLRRGSAGGPPRAASPGPAPPIPALSPLRPSPPRPPLPLVSLCRRGVRMPRLKRRRQRASRASQSRAADATARWEPRRATPMYPMAGGPRGAADWSRRGVPSRRAGPICQYRAPLRWRCLTWPDVADPAAPGAKVGAPVARPFWVVLPRREALLAAASAVELAPQRVHVDQRLQVAERHVGSHVDGARNAVRGAVHALHVCLQDRPPTAYMCRYNRACGIACLARGRV
eukprot:50254-Chlamydomonas_euryale.AAC.5